MQKPERFLFELLRLSIDVEVIGITGYGIRAFKVPVGYGNTGDVFRPPVLCGAVWRSVRTPYPRHGGSDLIGKQLLLLFHHAQLSNPRSSPS